MAAFDDDHPGEVEEIAAEERDEPFVARVFGQVLEGERARVSELFCRIASDPRHRSVVLVEAVEVASRQFDRWAMGLAEKNDTAEKLNAKFGFERGFDPTRLSADVFLKYILEMVTLEDQLISVSVPKR